MIEADGARWWQRVGNRLTDTVVPDCRAPWRPGERAGATQWRTEIEISDHERLKTANDEKRRHSVLYAL